MNKATSKLTKSLCILICMIMSLSMLTACKDESINGTWVISKQVLADGTVRKGDDIEYKESYTIANGQATYTCEALTEGADDITFALGVVETGKNTYDFLISEDIAFVTVEIKGKELIYTIDGETFYFTKEKQAHSNKIQG